MTDFGDTTVMQTTLASMFPISYQVLPMSPRTPQPMAPLAPEKVRPLVLNAFSLTYTGFLKITDLNTELLFLARSICAPTQSVSGGVGIIGGESLIIDITFIDVTVDDVATPLVIQGLTLTGSLSFSGDQTSLGIVHVGYNVMKGNLTFDSGVTIASLELYDCVINGDIVLPSGTSLVSLLVYGQYPQISLTELSNKKIYPLLTSLLYLNGVDGMDARDIPTGSRGFGAYTLSGLTLGTYPLITTLATPDPWSVDLETLFPNLVSLYVINYRGPDIATVPSTTKSRYSMLTFIGARTMTSLDLSPRAASLTTGIRIVGCPELQAVLLRQEPLIMQPAREYKTLVIERCALLYLRGIRGMNRSPTTLRLGDHTGITLTMNSRPGSNSRLLDYVLQGMPTLGPGNTTPAVASDYLPNVIVALAETVPSLILYPVMQTVEYRFTRPAAVVASDPSGGLTTTYTQYSGGSNPVVPSTGTTLSNAFITVSPFGIRYSLRVNPDHSAVSIGSTIAGLPSTTTNNNQEVLHGSVKGSIFTAERSRNFHIAMIIAIVLGAIIVLSAVITVALVTSRRKKAAAAFAVRSKTREPNLKK